MKVYTSKLNALSGSSYSEIYPKARKTYNSIKGQTKRQPYIRSTYFKKEKIFIELFWIHLNQKNPKQRNKRLKYYPCGLDLVRNSSQEPVTKQSPESKNILLHRFAGITPNHELFYVQIKENKRTKRKDLMSIFPAQ